MTKSLQRLRYAFLVLYLFLITFEVQAECDENITVPLKSHIVHHAIEHFRGNFSDVWASRHVTLVINSSYTEIQDDGQITNYVINKDGQRFSAAGKILADDEGIIHIKGFDIPGLIFPIFASPKAIAYYSCYPSVEGAGVSVVAARRGHLLLPDTMKHVLEAKVLFRRLQEEFGIPINDGVDYDHG